MAWCVGRRSIEVPLMALLNKQARFWLVYPREKNPKRIGRLGLILVVGVVLREPFTGGRALLPRRVSCTLCKSQFSSKSKHARVDDKQNSNFCCETFAELRHGLQQLKVGNGLLTLCL